MFPRDVLNTPLFDTRNEGDPGADIPGYAPIPPDGEETTYTWPLAGSQGYYSVMYSGTSPMGYFGGVRACVCGCGRCCEMLLVSLPSLQEAHLLWKRGETIPRLVVMPPSTLSPLLNIVNFE